MYRYPAVDAMPFELGNFIDEKQLLSLRRHSVKFIKGNNLEIVNPGLVLHASTSPIKRLKITKSCNSRSGYLAPLAASRHASGGDEDASIDDDTVNAEPLILCEKKAGHGRGNIERIDRQAPFREKSLAKHMEKMDKLNEEMVMRESIEKQLRHDIFQRRKKIISYRKKVYAKVTSVCNNNATAVGNLMRLLTDDRLWSLVQEARTMQYSHSFVPSSGSDLVVDYVVMTLFAAKPPPSAQCSNVQIYTDSLSLSNFGSEEVILPPFSHFEDAGALMDYSGELVYPGSASVDSSLKSMSAAVQMKRDCDGWISTRSDLPRSGSRGGSRTPSLASLSVDRPNASSFHKSDVSNVNESMTLGDVLANDKTNRGIEEKDDDTIDPEYIASRIRGMMPHPHSAPCTDMASGDIDDDVDVDVVEDNVVLGNANPFETADIAALESLNPCSNSIEELDGGSFITSLPGILSTLRLPAPCEISDNSTLLQSVHSTTSVEKACVKLSTLDAPSMHAVKPGSPLQLSHSPEGSGQVASFNTASAITHSLPAPKSKTPTGVFRAGSRSESIREQHSRGERGKIFVSMADRGLN